MLNQFNEIIERLERIEKKLNDLNVVKVSEKTDEKPMDVQRAADFINLENVQTVYRMVREGRIPFHKKGSRLFFFKSELVAWMKADKNKPQ
jgi:excisionase family DNA binding protein